MHATAGKDYQGPDFWRSTNQLTAKNARDCFSSMVPFATVVHASPLTCIKGAIRAPWSSHQAAFERVRAGSGGGVLRHARGRLEPGQRGCRELSRAAAAYAHSGRARR